MHFKYQKVIILLTIILLLLFITPNSLEANYQKTNTFQAQYDILNQKLYVSVTPSLYDYYSNITHALNSDSDYANFVTPEAVEPIAKSIQNITSNRQYSNETFADAVLKLVHQIPYAISDARYSVETLANNFGDCVALSILAASIMQAGGLDIVLIHYIGINPGHMNVGVYLPYKPVYHTAGMAPTDFLYNNKTYWTAEATPADNWKVGDQSAPLANVNTVIIPLNDIEQSSLAQVSSSLGNPLLPSSITVNVSQQQSSANVSLVQSNIGENTRAFNISGSISPNYSGESVSIYVNNGSVIDYFRTVTDDAGDYMLTWNFTSTGTYYITTSWSGTSNYAGADSETLTVFVGPESFIQFQTPNYNYIFEQETPAVYMFYQTNIAASEFRILQGVDNFVSIPLKTNVSLSYDFTVIQAGFTVSNVQAETITIPGSEQTMSLPGERYLGRNIPTKTRQIPAETITVPANVPTGMEPLTLPDDFNQTINDQFCFILQNNSGNYSLNVIALNDYEMSNITQGNESNSAFMNASDNIKENIWYNVTESISDNGITVNLYSSNGTLIENMVNPYDATDSNKIIILITNNVDSAVIFKDLTVQPLNNTAQQPESNEKTSNESVVLFPYVFLSILLLATFSLVIVYFNKKRQIRQKNT